MRDPSSLKHLEKSNKLIKKICAPSWFYLQKITQGCAVNKSTKKKKKTDDKIVSGFSQHNNTFNRYIN